MVVARAELECASMVVSSEGEAVEGAIFAVRAV